MLQQFITDPYIRKLKLCALKYRCAGEENFYLKWFGSIIKCFDFWERKWWSLERSIIEWLDGLAVRQSCWVTSCRATHQAKFTCSLVTLAKQQTKTKSVDRSMAVHSFRSSELLFSLFIVNPCVNSRQAVILWVLKLASHWSVIRI